MWRPRFTTIFFFLILELTPQPGVSQISNVLNSCPECKGRLLKDGHLTEKFYKTLVQNANYSHCPHHVKFTLPKGIACAENSMPWVRNITKCIDQGRTPCLSASENKQDFSKGSKDKPPTITEESTTSTAKTVPFLKLSTQTWKGGTSKPSEPPTARPATTQNLLETIGLTTTGPDSQLNNDLLHGNAPPTEKDETRGKMKHMTIAIISLILIVLMMMSIGMYIWCRRTRLTNCKNHCNEESVSYKRTALEDEPTE
ncbi:uncharacterized protein RB166_008300 [Leptodactylus fuscus]|uniref:uncharacterized protein LOC142202399 n=1 Tax=Leptodactylus fuscus TaxID=238119 RepID=UPI003F4F2EBA